MRITKILWIAIPTVFFIAVGLTYLGPTPEAKPEVKLRQIAVAADSSDDDDVERARLKIEDIYEQLEDGADFAQLAREQSEAPNAGQGGDMGWMGEGILPAVLEDAAFTVEAGQYSDIIEQTRSNEMIVLRILYVEERRNF